MGTTGFSPNARTWFTLGGAIALVLLGAEVKEELNPFTGLWQIARVTIAGKPVEAQTFNRISFEVSPKGSATIADYWTCGVARHTFAEGVLVPERNRLAIYEEDYLKHERSDQPCGTLIQNPDGTCAYTIPSTDEGDIVLYFSRTTNAETVFDLLGWR